MRHILSEKKIEWLYIFISAAVLINFSGLFVTIIGPDGALYASIAKTMALNNNFLELFVDGKDWLDKPHFPFWAAAISFKIFGISTWAYKLPAILFSLLGALYTYFFAKELYNKQVALWSVLIYLTAQHLILSNMDVRAEPYLTGLIIASTYHFYKAQSNKWFLPVLIGSIFAACAVMTKGIFALIPIGGAIAGELMIKRQWRLLFNLRWLVAAVLITIFILPELYSLYIQFDLHPEKTVFGKQNVSGLKFFFWDSQFGRFFNTGPIKKSSGDPFFFLHTILWAFLPWSLVLYAAIFRYIKVNIRKIRHAEWYCLSGALITTLVFSISKFQLPHYIIIVFPFFSILTAQYLCNLKFKKSIKAIKITQWIVMTLMVLLVIILEFYFNPPDVGFGAIILMLVCLALFITVSLTPTNGRFKVLYQTCALVFLVNIYLNTVYYPNLTGYQSDSAAAKWISKNNPGQLPVVQKKNGYSYGLDFYLNQPVIVAGEGDAQIKKPYLLFAETEYVDQLITEGKQVQRLKRFSEFRITRVKGKFLNHETRAQTLDTTEVVVIK